MLCYIFNFQKHIHCYYWCDCAVKWEIFGTQINFDLCYVTLTSDYLDTTTKQLAGHVLVINDTLYLMVHHLVQMICTNLDCLCRLAAMLDLRENRAFAMEGFMGIFNCGQEGYN